MKKWSRKKKALFGAFAILVAILLCLGKPADWLLVQAAETGDLPMARTALKLGANPDTSESGSSLNRLTEFWIGCGFEGETRRSAVLIAAYYKHTQIVKLLLDAGATPNNHYDRGGTTALMGAVWANDRESTRLLLDHGADANAHYKDNTTMLDSASHTDPEIITMLKHAGAHE